jgi:hypothetical protein
MPKVWAAASPWAAAGGKEVKKPFFSEEKNQKNAGLGPP